MQQGEAAATLLLEQIRSDVNMLPVTQVVLPTKMIVRATTGPHRGIRTRAG
jgi:DNA-binding LacI/PurR family transcriptional regulator